MTSDARAVDGADVPTPGEFPHGRARLSEGQRAALERSGLAESDWDSFEAERLLEDALVLEPTRFASLHPRPAWASLLPNVAVEARAATFSGARHDVTALLVAEVPIEVPALPGPPPAPPPARRPSRALSPRLGVVPVCLASIRDAAALRLSADPRRARSMIRRARQAAWLPELRLRIEKRLGRSESLDIREAVVGPLGLDTVDDVRLEVRATWDLSRVIFGPDEVAAQAQALRIADAHRELSLTINQLFFERRRLSVTLTTLLAAGALPAAHADDGVDPIDPLFIEEARKRSRGRAAAVDLSPELATLRIAEIDAELESLGGEAARDCR
jgi:hypothetical protein